MRIDFSSVVSVSESPAGELLLTRRKLDVVFTDKVLAHFVVEPKCGDPRPDGHTQVGECNGSCFEDPVKWGHIGDAENQKGFGEETEVTHHVCETLLAH
jgi:hypothetical protein